MGLFDWMKGNQGGSAEYPWDKHPSIHEHIRSHIVEGNPGLTEGGEILPDDERVAAKHEMRWAAGAMDGVFGHHFGSREEKAADLLLQKVLAYCQAPTVQNKADVYQSLLDDQALSLADPLLQKLRELTDLDHRRLLELARSLATEAPDRGPVKLGIAMLGLFNDSGLIEVLQTLGRHEEFSLYCGVALANTAPEPEQELWTLARNVKGWGRIQLVERLADTTDPEIREWMLREGFRNSVMNEYLAYTCATTGGLLDALLQPKVDDALLLAAGEIISALIVGGPAQGLDDYEDGAAAIAAYLGRVEERPLGLTHFNVVGSVRDWLTNEKADWSTRAGRGWTGEHRKGVLRDCDDILGKCGWRQQVLEGLGAPDNTSYSVADSAAIRLGIDPFPYRWEALRQSPLDAYRWYLVTQSATPERLGQILEMARRILPSDKLATGPALEIGLGSDYALHGILDYVLQGLGAFPSQGSDLVQVALRSPVIRNRYGAIRVLQGWGVTQWPAGMRESLAAAANREPEEKLRAAMKKVLAGQPME